MTAAVAPLAVVVATRGRPDALARLLTALGRQSLPERFFTVVVVNDGSHDVRYAEAVRPHLARVLYRTLPRRAGPAAARNRAVEFLGGTETGPCWLIFTDDDCLPPPDWLGRFWSRWKDDDGVDLVGGAVCPPPGENPGRLGRFLADTRFIRPMLDAQGAIVGLPTANLAVRRECFERVGGFDARFPYAGGEDIDLTGRLLRAGARAALADDWVTHHSVCCGWTEFCERYFRYGYGEALLRKYTRDAFPAPVSRRLNAKRAFTNVRPWDYRALALVRQISYETGRFCGGWRLR